MKLAVPVANGRLCMHFGHCEQFVIFNIDREKKSIASHEALTPPPHEPGVLPKWLSEQGVNFVIAGGMGGGAQMKFADAGVKVFGFDRTAKDAIDNFLKNELGRLSACKEHGKTC